jgi:hypothetical protein
MSRGLLLEGALRDTRTPKKDVGSDPGEGLHGSWTEHLTLPMCGVVFPSIKVPASSPGRDSPVRRVA